MGNSTQTESLHLVQEPMRQIQHKVQDGLRCHAMRGLQIHRLATYGGLGDGVGGEACRAALHRAGGLPPAGLAGSGAVDGGPCARAPHAGHVELPQLRLTTRG